MEFVNVEESSAPVVKLNYPTDFELISVTLVSQALNEPLNLKPQMVEISYFEDIFNNTISGKILISDAVGLLNLASINGTEFIILKFRKARDMGRIVQRIFRVFSITDRKFDNNNNFETYNINFCSEEFFLSEQYRISQAYSNMRISDIIVNICQKYLRVGDVNMNSGKNKTLYYEDTDGLYDFIIPNKRIFQAINWLSTYALPATKKPGADMLFYENSQGFCFFSLQTLFKQEPAVKYFFTPNNISSTDAYYNMGEKVFNVMSFDILNYVDTLNGVTKGIFNNRVISIDPLLRQKYVTDFNYNEYLKEGETLNKFPVTNNYKNRLDVYLFDTPLRNMEAGALRLVSTNKDQQLNIRIQDQMKKYNAVDYGKAVGNDIRIEKFLPNRVAQLSLSNYTRIKLIVPGNSDLYVGLTIEFDAFEIVPFNEKKQRKLDPYISGKYLISAIRHIIKPESYITVLELIKDSNLKSYSGVNNNDPVWNSVVGGIQL